MRRVLPLLILFVVMTAGAYAQDKKITGQISDRDTKEAVPQVTIQLLKADSTFVTGAISNDDGSFAITAPDNGKYILKMSSVGYLTTTKDVTISDNKNIALGKIIIGADAVMLKETTVTAQAAKMTIIEDTVIYNAAAYRVPEGSVVEELVKKLPGAEVDDDGNITINGKAVKKVKVDGKEFMTGDTKIAIKNLPTSIVEKVKAYDEKSDLSRITGIDDGEETTVIDFGLKEGMHKGAFANVDAGVGTKHRYAEKMMASYMNNTHRYIVVGDANNINDRGFSGGRGGGSNGLNASKTLGANFNYEKRNKFQFDGSVRWNHSDGDRQSISSVENFVSTAASFSNSSNKNFSRNDRLEAQMRLEWMPDSMTNIHFRPSFNRNGGDSYSVGESASFTEDPYKYVEDPLSDDGLSVLDDKDLVVNKRSNKSASNNGSTSVDATLQINRKLNNMGRNVTVRGSINYSDSDNKSLSSNDVHLYQVMNYLETGDSTYITNRYNLTPSKNWGYSLQATYSEPILRSTFLQFSYQFLYKYSKSDRSTFDFSKDAYDMFGYYDGKYDGWNHYFTGLTNPMDSYLDDDLSRFAEYKNYIHELRVTLRWIRQKYQLNAGVMLQPQTSKFIQRYQGINIDTTRNVLNFSPTLNLRYRFTRQEQLRVEYRGSTSQPSMSDLLDITDDSDPLNITKGNPGLKPSFRHNMRVQYNNHIQNHMQSIMFNANYSNTRNSISRMVTYDEKTGGRTTRPENINGNWDASVGFTYNVAIDSAGVWNVSTSTNYSYTNSVGYVTLNRNESSQKNTTRSQSVRERLQLSFRKNWFEITADGNVNYNHNRNLLQTNSNLDTWHFSYGGSMNIYAPWGSSITTDIHQTSRRGYSDATMNTNELIWNVQVAQSFMKGKPLTVTLQFYDILHQQSNFSRAINAMRRSDTSYNTITSYAMLHVIYRINVFGTREARRGMRFPGMNMDFGGGDRMRNRGMGGNRGGGGPRGGGFGGGFGGGRGR
ncbi:MAG: TonB-dependent receptor [Prevotella sp.]|nr:TonB-dependent receptor [Prevotella sp.]